MLKYFDNPKIWEIKEITPDMIPFSEAVVEMCRANACGRYGTYWTCPPGVGELSELERKIKSYNKAVVFSQKFDLEDSFDFEGMMDGQKKAKAVLNSICEKLRCDNVEYLALGCEGCDICEKCTYPESECRFPERAVVSVEACGINVVKLSCDIGIKYNNGENTVTYFCIILFR